MHVLFFWMVIKVQSILQVGTVDPPTEDIPINDIIQNISILRTRFLAPKLYFNVI